ncbi:hypothetical protein BKA70DRAFT_57248 [Coprinopsis sp. MPI-PUGE-AT-0042]|nr:hypothetical protein BKA70DRAFT_57248 [Coprinopsis sp. MPI-PUGE-AT-0042]
MTVRLMFNLITSRAWHRRTSSRWPLFFNKIVHLDQFYARDRQPVSPLYPVTLDFLKKLTLLDVKPSIVPPGNKATRITASGYPPILSFPRSCDLDAHIHTQVLHGIGLDFVFETAQPMLHENYGGDQVMHRAIGTLLDAPYSSALPGTLPHSETRVADFHRTSRGWRQPGDSATRGHLIASCKLEG